MAATSAGLTASPNGLHAVAAQLGTAAEAMATLAADPMIHPPLAADETSGSVAARLSGHGVVIASRAADGSAVLDSAAAAITQAASAYTAMDSANKAIVGLQSTPPPPVPGITPAMTTNAVAPDVPIVAPVPRPGEVTAAIMEAGDPDAGAGFVAACRAASAEFRNCGNMVRAAAGTLSSNLQGQAGPRITAALQGFADWTQTMADHADAIAQWATAHKSRFTQTRYQTPTTEDFTNRHRELQHAAALFASHPGPQTAAAITQAQNALTSLNNRTTIVAAGYHSGEIPQAPPGPPPVVPIVQSPAPQGDSPQSPPQFQQSLPGQEPADDGVGDGLDGAGGEGLEDDPNLTAGVSPAGQAIPAMASALPMMTGLLGGVIGAAASIPAGIGQQAQGLASQAMQGLGGLTSGLGSSGDELDELLQPSFGGEPIESGGGGGGEVGSTAPAGGAGGHLPPAANSMFAMSGPPGTVPMLGTAGPNTAMSPPAAGPGGAPMMMPMGGGMGAGAGAGTRAIKEPDKTIVVPAQPNSEPVKGEMIRRHTAQAQTDTPMPPPSNPPSVTVTSRRRRIEIPKDSEPR
uniref:PPE family protein n=1 Tax=Mycobacterium riyadhense TaxID=486698 RepID=A0A653EZF5_9MYCO|nr:PPE family protein [Mycobacterium riyadhense]